MAKKITVTCNVSELDFVVKNLICTEDLEGNKELVVTIPLEITDNTENYKFLCGNKSVISWDFLKTEEEELLEEGSGYIDFDESVEKVTDENSPEDVKVSDDQEGTTIKLCSTADSVSGEVIIRMITNNLSLGGIFNINELIRDIIQFADDMSCPIYKDILLADFVCGVYLHTKHLPYVKVGTRLWFDGIIRAIMKSSMIELKSFRDCFTKALCGPELSEINLFTYLSKKPGSLLYSIKKNMRSIVNSSIEDNYLPFIKDIITDIINYTGE